ncbi:DUF397 domain-containing protein [Streptomyces sp. L2]|uniref:DUF397 domain-containing protein n=1 Tax=Streptomyces sp. L2 TaxID=2162665 RepID=UPI00101179D6|nr:DUF397 domain-containing protein [Streptomyces sp. L2]
MSTAEPEHLAWFKSSYSGNEGGACLEVALAWVKSSYSGNEGGECLEAAATPHAVHIRDSKAPARAQLRFGAPQWTAFVRFAGTR